jgi:hypothetical protein
MRTHLSLVLFTLLGAGAASLQADTYTLDLSGTFDGSDLITISQNQATWDHKYWAYPTGVTLDGTAWNPQSSPTLTMGSNLIPADLSDYNVTTTILSGRDEAVAQIATNGTLQINVDDSPNGSSFYNVQVTLTSKPAPTTTRAAFLEISGVIDGSDEIHITPTEAQWIHKDWSTPTNIVVNGISWDPAINPILLNSGATTFLPAGVDLSTAVLVSETGRDLATYDAGAGYADVIFDDNPNGSSQYTETLGFGRTATPGIPEPGTAVLLLAGLGLSLGRRRRA